MTYQEAKEKAVEKRFGVRALGIILTASRCPVNPWAYFGKSIRRSWAYGYFHRLEKAGILKRVAAPIGRRGTNWFVLV